jgi:hypothetical protein
MMLIHHSDDAEIGSPFERYAAYRAVGIRRESRRG